MTRRNEPLAPARGAVVQHERGRVCIAMNCGTQLSIYNPSDRCSVHAGFVEPSANAAATGRFFMGRPLVPGWASCLTDTGSVSATL